MTDSLRTWTPGRTRVVAAGWAWLAVATWATSDALMGGLLGVCALIGVGLGIAVLWVGMSLLWLGNVWTRRGLLVWLTVPAAPVVAYVEARTAWPMVVRVWLSESALRESVERQWTDPFEHVDSHKAPPKQIGLFRVEEVSRMENGAVMFTTGRWGFAPSGVAYIPGGVPEQLRFNSSPLTHLYGPWYRCVIAD